MADSVVNPLTVRDFSKVILTLDNVLVQSEKLSETPSMQDGLDFETETDLRILGCELIQTSGILLKLPQVAMATGQVLFQRFYYSKSFVKHNMEVVAMACVNLASKIEESPRRIRDVINVFHHIKQVRSGRTIQPLILDQNYINIKNQVIKAERRVLKELGFCVHVKHPHKIIVMYLQVLDSANNRRLVQCACIAARQLQVPLPDSPPWYYLFEVEEDEIRDICIALLNLYSRPKPNCDELEKIVEKAKKIQVEAKLKAKGLSSEYGTPNSTSRQNSPKNVSPNPSILPGMRKVKLEEDHHSDGSHGSRNHNSKKRGHSGSDHSRSDRSPSHSRSRSSRTSSSRSTSRSPVSRKKMRSPSRKYKKERRLSPIRYTYKEKHSHKRKRRSRSRSQSRSHEEHYSKSSLKKYYKEKDRGYSPDRHRSRKHRNGHRANSRDRYDKYRR